MARSRYPRRGHRLAPAALGELLDCPVPAEYRTRPQDAGLRLCELDESVWQRFSPAECEALAKEVVAAIGRSARLPMAVGDRTLPPLPRGMSLADLDLEVRTINCLVAAGLHERPQDLSATTIHGILAMRGFWVKCLVDLLTALEFVIDHPEARRASRAAPTALASRARVVGHYPRPGCRVAPELLADVLQDPLPLDVVDGTPLAGRRLCDLDESVWELAEPETIARLAELIIAKVNVMGHGRIVGRRCLPVPPKGMRLEDLALENRTYNCLSNRGFGRQPEELAKRTIGEVLAFKAFGAKCLVDLLTSLETLCSRAGRLNDRLTEEARALAALPGADSVHFSDPRLGPLLRAMDTEANTVEELIQHVLRRRLDPPDPLRLYEQLREIRGRIEAFARLSLERELIDIFTPGASGRDRRIIAAYYGWDGGHRRTLEELGRDHRLSRERIRQVCVRAVQRSGAERFFAPVLDRALAFLAERVPAPAERLAAEFQAAGFSERPMSLEAVCEAARFLGRETPFAVVPFDEGGLVVPAETAPIPRLIVQSAKRAVLSYGATTIDEVAAEVSSQVSIKVDNQLIRITLQTLGDFQWLDAKRGWFQLEALPQYGLPNTIEKILSVAGEISVSKLRTAVTRCRRVGRRVPPLRVLAEFCRRMRNVEVQGRVVRGNPPSDWRQVLSGVEAGMVAVLREHGPVMERGSFEQRCIADGMNRFSFNAAIMCSPVIVQYGRSVYGLIGAKVDQKKLDALAARRMHAVPDRVFQAHGRTEDGRLYLVYRLSKAAITGGVLTVPSAVKHKLSGKFDLRTSDGQRAGTLVAKNGCAWGLGPVLRAKAAEPGDRLTLLFHTGKREALVRIADGGGPAPAAGNEPRRSEKHLV